ncbi:hypothetical protein [Deinococcus murrayi]|uniref:hypothetical protein n=1 Tax=Deinococcus murrayi TaxID=68910 RepID=UPI00047F4CFE|nr:hypothetical protein [Deinococcus murrayi]
MPPETYEEQIARELLRLGVTSRLKNAPVYHFWEIGKGKREAHKGLDAALVAFQRREMDGEQLTPKEQDAYRQLRELFADPEVNPYTIQLYNEDNQTASLRRLYVRYGYDKEDFKLTDPAETTRQIVDHFYPIRWPEFNELSDWELMREVIPAMQVARAQLKIYEEQRWLYDERSQRAAEVLAYRIQNVYKNQQLPERMNTTEQQRAIFEEYAARLERGTNARRWFQEMLSKLAKPRRKRQTS